jgi:Domain of unknown function (DUF4886)
MHATQTPNRRRSYLLLVALAWTVLATGCDKTAATLDAGVDATADAADTQPPDASALADATPQLDASMVSDAGEPADATPADRVLFVGNSYTAANSLSTLVGDLLTEANLGGYTMAYTLGAYRLEQHADDADGTHGDTTLRQHLVTGTEAALGWDVVVLQEQSQIPGFPETDPYWIAMVNGATTLRDLILATGADVVLFQTWGRRDGDSQNPSLYPDYATMQDQLTAGYDSLANHLWAANDPTYIAPVGEAWRTLHDTGDSAAFGELYATDGSHPSLSGSYLAACVLFATLTHSSPVGLTTAPQGVDATERLALQEIAEALVLDPTAPAHWTR